MKIAKSLFWGLSGSLTALVLAGCFNPIAINPPDPVTGAQATPLGSEPFTVTIHIEEDGSARAAAGPNGIMIGNGNICNLIQLVVVDSATKNIHAATDVRQENSGQQSVVLTVKALTYGKNYEFLLLMGHWERTYQEAKGQDFTYDETKPPTLLAVGHKTVAITSGKSTVTITVNPLTTDTKFTTADGKKTVNTINKGQFSLLPGDWKVLWHVKDFTTLLAAQEQISGSQNINTLFKSQAVLVGGNKQTVNTALKGTVFTLTRNLNGLAAKAAGYMNFNLEYVPFSLSGVDWSRFNDKSKFDLSGGKEPVWMIRNGINDQTQNDKTYFDNAGLWGGSTGNGNGAVRYAVLHPDNNDDGDDYTNAEEINNSSDPMDQKSHPIPPVNMVLVRGGSFPMGSTDTAEEKPIHKVTVSHFFMGKHEVTQKEWFTVMGTTVAQQKDLESGYAQLPLTGEGDDHPMYYVNWDEAVAYCNALSQKENLNPAYDIKGTPVTLIPGANGYRLPTEAEWEYAARGGINYYNPSYLYSGSDDADDVAWYDGNNKGGTFEVEKKKPNGLGLYDMSGNVWEWCWDWYGPYGSAPEINPTGEIKGSTRVIRGGSWFESANRIRTTVRDSYGDSSRSPTHGFRVVRPL